MPTRRPESPRIPPLPGQDWDDAVRTLLDGPTRGFGSSLNIFTTLVRHPRLFRRWTAFGGVLLTGTLPARHRELVILRTGWLCQAPYEWGQHLRLAADAGVTEAEIERLVEGADASGWTPMEAALLRATDELHTDACISDATWATLAEDYTDEQLIELPMLVGQYHLVSFTLNSLGVAPEPGLPGLPGHG